MDHHAATVQMGDFVFIKEATLRHYAAIDPHIAQKNSRPNCLILKDPIRTGIYWAVPLTSQSLDKYKDRAVKFPDRYRFYHFLGKETCFNVSEMLPLIRSDIRNVYVANGKKVRIRADDFNDIFRHVHAIVRNPKRLAQVSWVQAPVLLMDAQSRYEKEKQQRPKRTCILRKKTSAKDRHTGMSLP